MQEEIDKIVDDYKRLRIVKKDKGALKVRRSTGVIAEPGRSCPPS